MVCPFYFSGKYIKKKPCIEKIGWAVDINLWRPQREEERDQDPGAANHGAGDKYKKQKGQIMNPENHHGGQSWL